MEQTVTIEMELATDSKVYKFYQAYSFYTVS